jgi:N-methylhydantoinase B
VGAEIVSAVVGALSTMFPERVAGLATKGIITVARWPGNTQTLPLHLFLTGGAGAANGCDGWGPPGPFSRATTPSIEMVENQAPLRIRRLEMLPNSAGQGKWRGGFGTIAEFEFQAPTLLNAVIEGRALGAEGVAGGGQGTTNCLKIDGRESEAGLIWEHNLSNELVEISMGGGGGWGPPLNASARRSMKIFTTSCCHRKTRNPCGPRVRQ